MLRNYLKIVFRNIRKQKGFAFINIFGFTIGIAGCLLIALYVIHELSYDTSIADGDRIFRVATEGKLMESELASAMSPPPAAGGFAREFPEVEAATRLWPSLGATPVSVGEHVYEEEGIYYADASFFTVFGFPLVEGDPSTALQEPNSMVLTSSVARKYFGDESALGKTILYGDSRQPYTVTGVIPDVPDRSHFAFDMLRSMQGFRLAGSPNWLSPSMYTYIKLRKDATPAALDAKFPALYSKYFEPILQRFMRQSWEDFQAAGNDVRFILQPLRDIHLHSHLDHELKPAGSVANLTIFSLIAVFILLIACINYMNLTTARIADRTREVGVRKVVGSNRRSIFWQFMLESLLFSVIATLLAAGLVELAMNPFNQVTGIGLTWSVLGTRWIVAALVLFPVVAGGLAGSYPAGYLAHFRPVEALTGKRGKSHGSVHFRSGLVVFQFAVSIGLILAITLVYRQLHYMQQKNLGFDKENVLVIRNTAQLRGQRETFRQQLSRQSSVVSASVTDALPAQSSIREIFFRTSPPVKEGRSVQIGDEDKEAVLIQTDVHYLPALNLQVVAGRNFSQDFASDSAGAIVNQAFVKQFGWKDPLNQTFYANVVADLPRFHVIGVVKDFHMESLHEEIKPAVIIRNVRMADDIVVRLKPGNMAASVASLGKIWNEFMPDKPMKYDFLDQDFDALFRSEQQFGKIVGFFTLLAIFIACLGAFGLAGFTAEQRTKEIGIRKSLGASMPNIVLLLTRDFTRLVLLSFVMAVPVAYYFMHRWLQDFAYRVGIGPGSILITGVIALTVAFLSVGWQAVRAGRANPVESLRYE